MNHPHPWRISEENEQGVPGEHVEVEVVDADDDFICWAYREEAAAIVAASEAVGFVEEYIMWFNGGIGDKTAHAAAAGQARALLDRIHGDNA